MRAMLCLVEVRLVQAANRFLGEVAVVALEQLASVGCPEV